MKLSKMRRLREDDTQVKIIFAGMVFVLIAVLVPLFMISHYNFMSVDDVGYAGGAEAVWKESHSLIRVFAGQIEYAWNYWKIWQGTFAAEWFATSVMGIFVRDAYYVGTYLSLGGFVIAEAFLFMVILKKGLGADVYRAGIVSACMICLQVLLTPVPVEAFFWFCGAVLYTVTYNEAALLIALLLLLYFHPEKRWKRILINVCILLLTVLVSGGTYVTLIGMLLVYGLFTAWYWYRKSSLRWLVTGDMAVYLAGFLLNVLAPGNQKRLMSASLGGMEGIGAAEAILRSLKEASVYIVRDSILPCFVCGVLLLPLFCSIVKKKNYKFAFPALVTLVSFGIFAAQFTPTIYTLGMTGAGRIQNVYRWTFYIWLYGNELYWIGWLSHRFGWAEAAGSRENSALKSYLLPGWIAGGILLCFALHIWAGDTLTTVSAIQSLRRGEAAVYAQEYQERLKILEDETVRDAKLKPFTYFVYLLYFGDITEDASDWTNSSMASYFGKDSVVLIKEQQ